MNASFPYVSPSVSLPTIPPSRVVDAGYLDNYGVVLAAAWIDRHWPWILENTRGLLLIEIRAYPIAPNDEKAEGIKQHCRGGSLFHLRWRGCPLRGWKLCLSGTAIASIYLNMC